MLGDIAKQVPLTINGYQVMAHKDDWRLVFCAGLLNENRIADGLDGQKVVLGMRLRDIFKGLDDEQTRQRASDLIAIVQAFGDENSVQWTDPKESALREQYAKEVASV
jgi:hypothetical protein